MPSHYDVLGVKKDATPDEIKKAFRKLASKCHPDKDGNDAAMAALNVAYEVLSDQERRERYDKTGSDTRPDSPERMAENVFRQFVLEVLEVLMEAPDSNPVALMAKRLEAAEEQLITTIDKFKDRVAKIERQLRRTKRRKKDNKDNLFVQVMEHQRGLYREKLETLPGMLVAVRAAKKLSQDYEFVNDAPQYQQQGTTLFTQVFGRSR